MTPWILSEAIIIALLEYMDAPTSLAFVSAAKFLQPYMQHVDHIKKLYVGNNSACVITHSGKFVSLIKRYSINEIEYNDSQLHNFAEFVKQQKLIIRKVSCGAQHIAVITSTGKLILWGDNKYGQCSLPDEYTGDNETTFCGVSCSDYGTVAITTSGKIVLFGDNEFKEGNSPPEEETFCKIKCGSSHIAALTTTEKLFMWTRFNGEISSPSIYENISFRGVTFAYNGIVALIRSGKIKMFGTQDKISFNAQHPSGDVISNVSVGRHVTALTTTGKIISWDICGACEHYCEIHHIADKCHNFRKIKSSYDITIALTYTGELLMCCSALKFDGRENIAEHAKKLIREYK